MYQVTQWIKEISLIFRNFHNSPVNYSLSPSVLLPDFYFSHLLTIVPQTNKHALTICPFEKLHKTSRKSTQTTPEKLGRKKIAPPTSVFTLSDPLLSPLESPLLLKLIYSFVQTALTSWKCSMRETSPENLGRKDTLSFYCDNLSFYLASRSLHLLFSLKQIIIIFLKKEIKE